MMGFNLDVPKDRDRFAKLVLAFQSNGVEFKLSYETDGYVYLTPTGAVK